MALSPADRIRLGLDEPPPGAPADEFIAPAAPSTYSVIPARTHNPRLALKEGTTPTAPRIRQLVNELLAGNIQEVDYALKQMLAANPKQGLELYIELAKFSLPQLKAVAVQVDDRSENPRTLSIAQLQQALQGD